MYSSLHDGAQDTSTVVDWRDLGSHLTADACESWLLSVAAVHFFEDSSRIRVASDPAVQDVLVDFDAKLQREVGEAARWRCANRFVTVATLRVA